MQPLQTYFEKSLKRKVTGVLGIPISEFRKEVALKLLERLKRVKLYAHTYVFFLNFNSDPNAGLKMVQTAENMAKEIGITKEESDN